MKNRVQGPRTPEEFAREAAIMSRGQRIPGDELNDVMRAINHGREIMEAEPGAYKLPEAPPSDLEREVAMMSVMDPEEAVIPQRQAAPEIPYEITDVLNSPERAELLEVARMLRRANEHARTLLFLTPVGDIKCSVNWMSCRPQDIREDSMFFVKTRANSLAFIPKPGAVFDIAFEGTSGQTSVVCLSPPLPLYPGVDLLCFLPHTPLVEKNGQLKEGAPSVVSGEPSDHVVDGEPVKKGEHPLSKSAFANALATQPPKRDFDTVRTP